MLTVHVPPYLLLQYGKVRDRSKTLLYTVGRSEISVNLNTYVDFEDA